MTIYVGGTSCMIRDENGFTQVCYTPVAAFASRDAGAAWLLVNIPKNVATFLTPMDLIGDAPYAS
jgi:hypothetical protein